MGKYSAIDLFAGAGGLSLGFMQTQKFDVKVAFENNPDMQATYQKNHPGVEMQGDVCKANYKDIEDKYGKIDVVIGGPPCQGFSNANRQKNHAISQNNMLVKQYVRAILELQPKAFVMENVSMLKSDVHRFYLTQEDMDYLKKYNIPTRRTKLHLLDKSLYYDGLLDIVKSKEKITTRLWTEKLYAEINVIYKTSKNEKKLQHCLEKHKKALLNLLDKHEGNGDIVSANDQIAFDAISGYYEGKTNIRELKSLIEPAIMYQRMLGVAMELIDNHLIIDDYLIDDGLDVEMRSFAVLDYIKNILMSKTNGYIIDDGVLCAADYGAPQKRDRFVMMGIKSTVSPKVALPKGHIDADEYRTVSDAISDLEDVQPIYDVKQDCGIRLLQKETGDLATQLRNSQILYNHIITKTTPTAMERFKSIGQGQNFHSLDEKLKTNTYTDATRTQNTIYLRLDYNEPSGTVVNVRKSMWIHPTLDRAISIREAARLQTFPDSFVFCGSKDKQYQQVGNAVPPILAKSIAKKLATLLTKAESGNK